jgi:kynurenine formamidase
MLPEPFGNTWRFAREQISRYDELGPAWYWNNFSAGEHTGTHFRCAGALDHRPGPRTRVPGAGRLIGPAAVIDVVDQVAKDPDFLLEVRHNQDWEAEHGPLPAGGWLLLRTGWDARSHSQTEILNADENGPHTPGVSIECARWLAEQAPVLGIGAGYGFDAITVRQPADLAPVRHWLAGDRPGRC